MHVSCFSKSWITIICMDFVTIRPINKMCNIQIKYRDDHGNDNE